MADDTVKTATIDERIAALQPILAKAVAEKWPTLGIAEGTKVQDHKQAVASAVFDLDVSDGAMATLVDVFVDKVKALRGDKEVVAVDAPRSDVHTAGPNKIAAYVVVTIGFITL